MTHSTQSWLSAGGHGLHRLLAPSAVMCTLRKALLAAGWGISGLFYQRKNCDGSAVPCPVSSLSEPQPQAGLNTSLSSLMPRGCCKGHTAVKRQSGPSLEQL